MRFDLPAQAGLRDFFMAQFTYKVKDQKGNIYQVISFEVMWKRKDISDDEKTGKPKTVFYTVGATLNGNQFSKEWINEFTNYIKAGEQLFFDTILYFDPNKKANYKAPGFVITIQ